MVISAILNEFGQLFPSHPTSPDAVEVYARGLAILSDDELAGAFTRCREECERFPVPADFVKRAERKKNPKRSVAYHWAPDDFRQAYAEANGTTFVTQDQVKAIQRAHGDPETASPIVAPPADVDFQIAVATMESGYRRHFKGWACAFTMQELDLLGKQLDQWRATGVRPEGFDLITDRVNPLKRGGATSQGHRPERTETALESTRTGEDESEAVREWIEAPAASNEFEGRPVATPREEYPL